MGFFGSLKTPKLGPEYSPCVSHTARELFRFLGDRDIGLQSAATLIKRRVQYLKPPARVCVSAMCLVVYFCARYYGRSMHAAGAAIWSITVAVAVVRESEIIFHIFRDN